MQVTAALKADFKFSTHICKYILMHIAYMYMKKYRRSVFLIISKCKRELFCNTSSALVNRELR